MARNSRGQRDVRQVTEQTMDESRGNRDDFYMFSARSGEAQNTVEMLIEDKPINVILDSGANCNSMSEGVFEFVKGGNASLLECDKGVYAYGSNEPLQLRGKCDLIVEVPQTRKSLNVEFYITRGKAATLLGRDTSELLGVLRVGVPINSCELKHDSPRDTAKQANREPALKAKFPKVFEGLGKLKDYQIKLHIDKNVQPVAQQVRRIPFNRRAKVNEKLEELLKLDVIEKVEGPTSWVNPLVVVEKPNGDHKNLPRHQTGKSGYRERETPSFHSGGDPPAGVLC